MDSKVFPRLGVFQSKTDQILSATPASSLFRLETTWAMSSHGLLSSIT